MRAIALSALLLAAGALFFALQLHLNDLAVLSQHAPGFELVKGAGPVTPGDVLRLPFPVIFHELVPGENYHVALMLLAFAQAGVLYGLWKILPAIIERPALRLMIVLTGAFMIWLALTASSIASFDMYAYVGYAKLGFAHAYAPIAQSFNNDFAIINRLWGRPMVPCYYGPLWLLLERFAAGSAHTLGQAISATRVLGLGSVAFLVVALSRCRVPRTALVLVVLNPAILGLYVVNGHNDLIGVAFAVLAVAFVTTAPFIAAIMIACAGLVKVSLLALCLIIFAGSRPFRERIGFVVLSVCIVLAGSYAGGGRMYITHLVFHANRVTTFELDSGVLLSRVLAIIAITVLGVAFIRGKVLRAGSWPLFILSNVAFQWYLVWALPYAVRAKALLVEFLVAVPVVAAALETAYPNRHYTRYMMVAMIAYALYDAIRYRVRAIPVSLPREHLPARPAEGAQLVTN